MTKMKQPIKPTDEQIAARAEKTKHAQVKIEKVLRSGTYTSVMKQIAEFAEKNNVSVDSLSFTLPQGWSGRAARVWFSRQETDAERLASVRKKMLDAYDSRKREYDRHVAREKRDAERAAESAERFTTAVTRIAGGCCPTCGHKHAESN